MERSDRKGLFLVVALVWLTASVTFYFGMYSQGSTTPVVSRVFFSLIEGAKMFVLNDNTASLSRSMAADPHYMLILTFVRILAFCTSIWLLVLLLFKRVRMAVNLAHANVNNKTLAVYFGVNPISLESFKSIREDDELSRTVFPVFVECRYGGDEEPLKRISISNLILLMTPRMSSFESVSQVGGTLTLSDVVVGSGESVRIASSGKSTEAIFRSFGLKRLWRKVSQASFVHFYFLSEDGDANISGARVLRRALLSESDLSKYTIYVHAKEGINADMLETPTDDVRGNQTIEAHVIDRHALSILDLVRTRSDLLPVKFVDIDTGSATVKSDFYSLVIGFGRTGQVVAKFLYEFGAFVPFDCGSYDRSGFRCDVFDPLAESLSGGFYADAPALVGKTDPRTGEALIHFHSSDSRSLEMSAFMERMAGKLNYVVVCTGDDSRNLEIAAVVLEMVMRSGRDISDKFKVIVESFWRSDGVQKCFDDINRKLGAEVAVPFGFAHNVFSYSNIENAKAKCDAVEFFNEYMDAGGIGNHDWKVRHQDAIGGSYEKLRSTRRKEVQNIHNALQMGTYVALSGLLIDSKVSQCLKMIGSGSASRCNNGDLSDPDHISYSGGYGDSTHSPIDWDNASLVMKNLAKTEHLRWLASHECMGYTQADDDECGCNERTRTHNTMVSWDELPAKSVQTGQDYILYDYAVIETTLKLLVKNN